MVTVMEEWPRWSWTALGAGVGCGEQAGAGVSEVVDSEALRQFCFFDGLVPDLSSEVAAAQRRTGRCGEHERFGIVGDVMVEVFCEEVAEESGDGHDATAMVLRWPEVEVSGDVGERFGVLDAGLGQVASFASEGSGFSPPEPAVGEQVDEGAVRLLDGVGEEIHFVGVEEQHLGFGDPR